MDDATPFSARIVERLRSPQFADVAEKYLMVEAADEIERLRRERAELLKERSQTEMQKMIDYWGRRTEKAEAEIERLRRELELEVNRNMPQISDADPSHPADLAEIERLRAENIDWSRQNLQNVRNDVNRDVNKAMADEIERLRKVTLSDNDLYYLRSIKRQLDEVKEALADTTAFSLGGMALADNLDWLDCFILGARTNRCGG